MSFFPHQLNFSLGVSLVSALAYRSKVSQVDYEHTPEKNHQLGNGEKQTHTVQEMMDLFVKLIFSEEK